MLGRLKEKLGDVKSFAGNAANVVAGEVFDVGGRLAQKGYDVASGAARSVVDCGDSTVGGLRSKFGEEVGRGLNVLREAGIIHPIDYERLAVMQVVGERLGKLPDSEFSSESYYPVDAVGLNTGVLNKDIAESILLTCLNGKAAASQSFSNLLKSALAYPFSNDVDIDEVKMLLLDPNFLRPIVLNVINPTSLTTNAVDFVAQNYRKAINAVLCRDGCVDSDLLPVTDAVANELDLYWGQFCDEYDSKNTEASFDIFIRKLRKLECFSKYDVDSWLLTKVDELVELLQPHICLQVIDAYNYHALAEGRASFLKGYVSKIVKKSSNGVTIDMGRLEYFYKYHLKKMVPNGGEFSEIRADFLNIVAKHIRTINPDGFTLYFGDETFEFENLYGLINGSNGDKGCDQLLTEFLWNGDHFGGLPTVGADPGSAVPYHISQQARGFAERPDEYLKDMFNAPGQSEEDLNEHLDEMFTRVNKYLRLLGVSGSKIDVVRECDDYAELIKMAADRNLNKPTRFAARVKSELVHLYSYCKRHPSFVHREAYASALEKKLESMGLTVEEKCSVEYQERLIVIKKIGGDETKLIALINFDEDKEAKIPEGWALIKKDEFGNNKSFDLTKASFDGTSCYLVSEDGKFVHAKSLTSLVGKIVRKGDGVEKLTDLQRMTFVANNVDDLNELAQKLYKRFTESGMSVRVENRYPEVEIKDVNYVPSHHMSNDYRYIKFVCYPTCALEDGTVVKPHFECRLLLRGDLAQERSDADCGHGVYEAKRAKWEAAAMTPRSIYPEDWRVVPAESYSLAGPKAKHIFGGDEKYLKVLEACGIVLS